MFTLLCTVSSTTVFSIHVLTSFLHGYSATLAAKLFIKLELIELIGNALRAALVAILPDNRHASSSPQEACVYAN